MQGTRKRKTSAKRASAKPKVSRHCTCENVSMSNIGTLGRAKKRTAVRRKTMKTGCKIIRIRGRGVRKGCYKNGKFRFVKS